MSQQCRERQESCLSRENTRPGNKQTRPCFGVKWLMLSMVSNIEPTGNRIKAEKHHRFVLDSLPADSVCVDTGLG